MIQQKTMFVYHQQLEVAWKMLPVADMVPRAETTLWLDNARAPSSPPSDCDSDMSTRQYIERQRGICIPHFITDSTGSMHGVGKIAQDNTFDDNHHLLIT